MPPVETDDGFLFWVVPGEARLFYEKVGTFLVRGGQDIVIDPAPGAEEGVIRFFILGLVSAVLLHQRGFFVLHANTVALNGHAVAFVGEQGQGKSTTSAAFYTQGHGIASDDITAIRIDGKIPLVYPGVPRLKLCPDTADFFGDRAERLPHLYHWVEKYAHRVAREFPQTPLPLECIYLLAYGERLEIEPLQPRDALMTLVRHSYPIVAHSLKATGTIATHFRQCEKLMRHVSMRLLRRPRDLSALPDLVRRVEADLAQTP